MDLTVCRLINIRSDTRKQIPVHRHAVGFIMVICLSLELVPGSEGMEIQEHSETYRAASDRDYRVHLFLPGDESVRLRSGIVFFHGWGKSMGPEQFFPHCRYFATRGMVAGSAEYRVMKHDSPEYLSLTLENARAAVGWFRSNAADLRLDPHRLVAAGGSGGGWAAAATAMIPGSTQTATEPHSSVPDAVILFNPVVRFRKTSEFSPAEYIRADLPPMTIFHGEADELIPVESVRLFCDEMIRVGNRCDLRTFPGKKHSFFNYGLDQNRPYYETLMTADEFLVQLGFLEGAAVLKYEDVRTE